MSVVNYGKKREAELRERLQKSEVDQIDQFVEELRETPQREDLRFIDIYDQVLSVKIDDEKYVRVYMICLPNPMYITHVDVGVMDQYYLDTRSDVEEMLPDTIGGLADYDADIIVPRNKLDWVDGDSIQL